ncbi:putative membrane protein [Lachnellula willkommii]|uniref:Putative membrane protein n=1 Tax=Lachnellula willkommii TaxID=215461 RepID=A0A559MG01_9HELO|nr:putative membrane protein [Lachnellula willkommii]
MRSILPLLSLSALLAPVQSLFFYIDGTTPKCFFEELPKDTLVVGHYSAEEYDENMKAWAKHDGLSIAISVDVIYTPKTILHIAPFFPRERCLAKPGSLRQRPPRNQPKGSSSGRFTFTAADSGDHKICFTPSSTSGGQGWLSALHPMGGIKLTLDLAIGETSAIESTDKGKIQDIVQKVKDLNGRLNDIRREQVFQREREAEFRDQSESTNARVVRWTLVQLVVLGITCAWQLSHLRSFFIKQKLT